MNKWYKILKAYDGHEEGDVVEIDVKMADPLVTAGILELTDPPEEAEDQKLIKEFQDKIKTMVTKAVTGALGDLNVTVDKGFNLEVGKDLSDDDPDFGYLALKGLEGDDVLDAFAHDVFVSRNPGRVSKTFETLLQKGMSTKAPTGMGEFIGEDGGFLVPPSVSTRIMDKVFEVSDFLRSVELLPFQGNSLSIPAIREKSRVDGSRGGGVLGRWIGESTQGTLTDKIKIDMINLRLKKCAVFLVTSEELMSDTGGLALGRFLTRMASRELAFQITDSLINGTGVDRPMGVLNAPALITTTRDTTSRIKFNDITNMWVRCHIPSRGQAIWLIHPEAEAELDLLGFRAPNDADTDAVGGHSIYLPPGGLNDTPFGRLKGRPVIPCEFCAVLGTTGDIIFVDFSEFIGIQKAGIRSATSIHLRFDFDEQVFRFTLRLDVKPWWNSAVTNFKGSGTVSPYTALT